MKWSTSYSYNAIEYSIVNQLRQKLLSLAGVTLNIEPWSSESDFSSIKKAAASSIGRSGENLPPPALTIIFCPRVGRLVSDIEAALDGIDEESSASFFVEID